MEKIIKYAYSFQVKNKGIKYLDDFVNISRKIFNYFNLPITYFAISEMKSNKTKAMNFNEKNTQKFKDLSYDDLSMVDFDHNSTKINFPTKFNINVVFLHRENTNLTICITFKTELGILLNPMDAVNKIIDALNNYCDIITGFGLIMENDKIPEEFIQGSITPLLTEYEKQLAYSISYNKNFKTNKLPDVFLINILPNQIIQDDIFNRIKTIIGNNHVSVMKDKYFVFELPIEFNKYTDDSSIMNIRYLLRNELEQNNLLYFKTFEN